MDSRIGKTSFFTIIILLGVLSQTVHGCPTCKNAMHDSAAFAFAVSIIFMMIMPFLIFGFWALTIYRLRSKMVPVKRFHEEAY
ncbi:MAG: hypothetical protein AAF623_18675 [Planctomycetota bacterium]